MTDERSDSLASQAASWVPPWERAPREPDRDYQAQAVAEHSSDEEPGVPDEEPGVSDEEPGVEPLPGESDEPSMVDSPVEVPDEEVVEFEPDIAVPEAIEDAAEEDADGLSVDAPLPPDGDDAGDVFDRAADDDVSDDSEVDMPFYEEEAASVPEVEEASAPVLEEEEAPAFEEKAAVPEAPVAVAEIPTQVIPMDDGELRAALEAIMLVVDEPVAELQLAQIVEQPVERVGSMLEDISARFTAAGHGFDLRRAAGGWRLYTRPEYAPYVERFVLDGQSVRLTQAALETLAVVAYKQPVTRSRISAIRGVNCDGVMRTLATRGLIEECGTEPETGAHLYRTTGLFLEKLGLDSVDQLPPLAPFLPDDVEEVLDASG